MKTGEHTRGPSRSPWLCPFCKDRKYQSATRLRGHIQREHEWFDGKVKPSCDECERIIVLGRDATSAFKCAAHLENTAAVAERVGQLKDEGIRPVEYDDETFYWRIDGGEDEARPASGVWRRS